MARGRRFAPSCLISDNAALSDLKQESADEGERTAATAVEGDEGQRATVDELRRATGGRHGGGGGNEVLPSP